VGRQARPPRLGRRIRPLPGELRAAFKTPVGPNFAPTLQFVHVGMHRHLQTCVGVNYSVGANFAKRRQIKNGVGANFSAPKFV
jgi:hypothetical protein